MQQPDFWPALGVPAIATPRHRRGDRSDAITDEPDILGVLNVTPDSFSDGGQFLHPRLAVRRGLELVDAGAWAVDVGGESTRPGASPVSCETELSRILPVVGDLAGAGVIVSVDTMKAPVAAAAIDAGARIVNDVSGGRSDPAILDVVARTDVTFVVSHWRGPSRVMQQLATYDDIVAEVCCELEDAVQRACAAGISRARLIVDPGIGFAKAADHNWRLLSSLPELCSRLGLPVMVGTSRKRFLGQLVHDELAAETRDDLSAMTSALAAVSGAGYLRVHDVRSTRRAVRVARAWMQGHA